MTASSLSFTATDILEARDGAVCLRVKLAPKANANRIMQAEMGPDGRAVLKVQVTAVPEKGKANKALIQLLAKYFGLPKSTLSISAGETSRSKTIALAGEPDLLFKKLADRLLADHLIGAHD